MVSGWFGRVRVLEVELFDKVGRVSHSGGRNPGVFGFWVSFPFDQVLDSSSVCGWSRVYNFFHFIMVVFTLDDVRWRTGVVGSVFRRFFVGSEKGVVKYWVDAPGWRELETRVGGCCGEDFKRSVSFGGEFCFGVSCFDIGAFEPDLLALGEGLGCGWRAFAFHDFGGDTQSCRDF